MTKAQDHRFDGADIILPSQFFDDRTPMGGEQKLMLAVMVDAINQLNWNGIGKMRRRQAFAEAAAWVREPGAWLFSFETVCDILGIDPVALREHLEPYLVGRGGVGQRLRLKETIRAQHMTANRKRSRKK